MFYTSDNLIPYTPCHSLALDTFADVESKYEI